MKNLARALAWSLLAAAPACLAADPNVSQQSAPAGLTPAVVTGSEAPAPAQPGNAKEPSATVGHAAEGNAAAPAGFRPPTAAGLRRAVDSLSDAEARQALELLRGNDIRGAALDEAALTRATLQGLLERLGGGAGLRVAETTGSPNSAAESPFRSEILDERIGYVRLGSLTRGRLAELDAALENFRLKRMSGLILDLRATPPSSDFELAAEVAKRFTPKGRVLFSIRRPSLKQERIYTSDRDPAFRGVAVTLVRRETAGAPEVIAAVLRGLNQTLVVGQTTAGQAAEFAELPLGGGNSTGANAAMNAANATNAAANADAPALRVAVAEISLPGEMLIFPDGLKPDLFVAVAPRAEEEALRLGLEQGVGGLVFEAERARFNEAALVHGLNPEIDTDEAAQRERETEKTRVVDAALQRAVDLVTTVQLIGKPGGDMKGPEGMQE